MSRKVGGSEHITQESPAQDPSLSTFSQSGYPQLPTTASQSTYLFPTGLWCTRVVMNPGLSSNEPCTPLRAHLCRQLLQYPCVHFTHVFGTRDRCTNARVGSSFGTNEECQTSSSHVHLLSVHRSGSTMPLRSMALCMAMTQTLLCHRNFLEPLRLDVCAALSKRRCFSLMLGSLNEVGDISVASLLFGAPRSVPSFCCGYSELIYKERSPCGRLLT